MSFKTIPSITAPLWRLLTSLEFGVGVRILLFFGDFSLNFLVTRSKFVYSVDFDIVYTLNIDLLRYDEGCGQASVKISSRKLNSF